MYNALAPHHIIFSVENAIHPIMHGTNPSTEDAVKFLNSQGEDAQIIHGHRGIPEYRILIQNPKNVNGLFQMAKNAGQDSLLHSQNGQHVLHYLNGEKTGQTTTGTGIQFMKEPPADNYSTIHTAEGPLYFQHNLNFSDTTKSQLKEFGDQLQKSDDHGYCTMFLFEGVDKPDILHVTHQYFGKDYNDKNKIIAVLENYFKEKPFESFTKKFDKEEFFGKDKDIGVLVPKNNKSFFLDLKEKLDQLHSDKWPVYKPHATVSDNVDAIDFPIVDYVLVKGGKVIWSAKGKLYKAIIAVSYENELLQKKESQSLESMKDYLESPVELDTIDIPEHIQVQWSSFPSRWS